MCCAAIFSDINSGSTGRPVSADVDDSKLREMLKLFIPCGSSDVSAHPACAPAASRAPAIARRSGGSDAICSFSHLCVRSLDTERTKEFRSERLLTKVWYVRGGGRRRHALRDEVSAYRWTLSMRALNESAARLPTRMPCPIAPRLSRFCS